MSNFRIGQRVVCLNSDWQLFHGETGPSKGVTYTVRGLSSNRTGILLEEIRNTPIKHVDYFGEPAWNAIFFRAVQEADLTASLASEWKESVPTEQEIVNIPEPQHA